ncbi:unnamed protein product, partial [Allacma fusca]
GIPFKIEDQRIRCLAHIINLACQAALKTLKDSNFDGLLGYVEVDELSCEEVPSSNHNIVAGNKLSIYGKLKKAINRIKTSNILLESLKHFCEMHAIPQLKLLNDMPVRWNSTFKLLERRLALDATMKSDDVLSCFVLSTDDWNVVEQMVKFLE